MVNQAKFEKAMRAALDGPEVKKIKIKDHEFNVKPVTLDRDGSTIDVKGQLSHHLTWRDDDQIHYQFTVVPGQVLSITDIEVNIDRSFMDRAIKVLWEEVLKEVLVELLKSKVEDELDDVPLSSALRVAQNSAESVYERSQQLLDGSWEGEANFVIVNIAARISLGVAATANSVATPLAFARRLSTRRRRVRGPRTRDPRRRGHRDGRTSGTRTRPRPRVRDHR